MSGRVVFLDRDGTLIEDPGYLADPALVRLLPGAAEAMRLLEQGGWARVVISNQSGIGRGHYTLDAFHAVQREVDRQLAEFGASINLTLCCPHHPDDGCTCRKPGTALHREAAARLDVDLLGSWCVGDRLTDLQPAPALGGRAILVATGEGSKHHDDALALGVPVVVDLLAAVHLIDSSVPSIREVTS